MHSRIVTTVMALQLSVLIACATTCAQKATAGSLGWDLSYSSVLDANNVGPDDWIRKWLGPNYHSAAQGWISSWSHGPIQSSVLLEFPSTHAGERIIIWLVRTKDQAYYYERAEGDALLKDDKPPHETNETLDVQTYEKFFSVVSTWQQASPLKPEETPKGAPPGYIGFLSIYSSSGSRQMLLTSTDYAICETKECKTWKPGRLFEALRIIPRFGELK